MRKKAIFVVLCVILLAVVFRIMGPSCAFCNNKGADHKIYMGETYKVCDACYVEHVRENAGTSNYSDYDNDKDYDYDYDKDDDDDNEYKNTGKYCEDCGVSIPSNRFYCDKCLGYGTCQDCGKDIPDDRFYCDKCLGYGTCQDCGKDIPDDRFYCNDCLYD